MDLHISTTCNGCNPNKKLLKPLLSHITGCFNAIMITLQNFGAIFNAEHFCNCSVCPSANSRRKWVSKEICIHPCKYGAIVNYQKEPPPSFMMSPLPGLPHQRPHIMIYGTPGSTPNCRVSEGMLWGGLCRWGRRMLVRKLCLCCTKHLLCVHPVHARKAPLAASTAQAASNSKHSSFAVEVFLGCGTQAAPLWCGH